MWLTIGSMFNCQFWLLWRPFCGLVSLRIWCKEGFMSVAMCFKLHTLYVILLCLWVFSLIAIISICICVWEMYMFFRGQGFATPFRSIHTKSFMAWYLLIKWDNHPHFYPKCNKCKIDCSHRGHCIKFNDILCNLCSSSVSESVDCNIEQFD